MNNKAKIIRFVSIILIIGATLYLLFNNQGLLKYKDEYYRVQSLREEIRHLKEENEKLERTIDSLQQKIPARIEQTARENLDMKKPNEVVVKTEVK